MTQTLVETEPATASGAPAAPGGSLAKSPTGGPAPGGATKKPADLVLEGGGVKGIGLAGAVRELDAAGYVFKRVAGTSAGAIAAALIAALNAAQQPLSRLDEILATVDYPSFTKEGHLRHALGGIADAEQLLLHMGLHDGDYLVDWLSGQLRDIGVTRFGDLKLVDGGADSTLAESQKYTLVVFTADITRSKCVQLPWDYPAYGITDVDNSLIVDAVRASMSIPFFFDPVRHRAPALTGDGYAFPAETVTWVDGGMLSNFPVEAFDRKDGAESRWPTIGIKLSARAPLTAAAADIGDVVSEAIACLHTMMDNADRYYLTPDKAGRTVFVDSCGVQTTNFGITRQQQDLLFASGRQGAQDWLTAVPGR